MDHGEGLFTEEIRAVAAGLEDRVQHGRQSFTLIAARCNLKTFRGDLIQSFTERFEGRVLEVRGVSAEPLSQTITKAMAGQTPDVIVVRGLGWVYPVDAWLAELDHDLDRLRQLFPLPVVVWMNNVVFERFMKAAPRFAAAAELVHFPLSRDGFGRIVNQMANRLFEKVLDTNANWYQEHADYIPVTNSSLCSELLSEQAAYKERGEPLDPELEANLEFVLGQETDYSTPPCRIHYENSLARWRLVNHPVRQAVVLFYLGLGWRLHGARNQARRHYSYERAAEYFAQCVALFEQVGLLEHAGRYINFLAGVLQRLGRWDELDQVIQKSLAYRQQFPDGVMLARTHGFIAERELAMGRFGEARKHALQALGILEDVLDEEEEHESPGMRSLAYHRGWYLYSLAKSYARENQADLSLEWLQIARAETRAEFEPELYMSILSALQKGFHDKGQYQTSFKFRTELREVAREFGMAAFVGAVRLHPYRKVIRLSAGEGDFQRAPAPELAASGREGDLEYLLRQLDRRHQPLIVTGPSGVGKSSMILAGVLPMLENRKLRDKPVKFGLCSCYLDWVSVLAGQMEVKFGGGQGVNEPEQALITRLNEYGAAGWKTVLIFDQLEEFFWSQLNPDDQARFFRFLDQVLAHPQARVLLCLREDSLDKLRAWHGYEAKEEPYRLRPFTPEEAAMVVRNITERAQYSLDDDLLHAWIQDLADQNGVVFPIELQIMGAQMQAENIHTRDQYAARGPKAAYIQRWLQIAAEKCGLENTDLARGVLALLARDAAGVRPYKTAAWLQELLQPGVESWSEADRNFLVTLEILEKSGMIHMYPESPSYRYQISHDFIADFIRAGQWSSESGLGSKNS